MTPGARLQAAIEILERFEAPGQTATAERLLAAWARGARYAGSKDRAAVADHLYAALRRLGTARLGAPAEESAARAALFGALRLEGAATEEIAARADGGPHRPAPLSPAERDRLEALPAAAAAAPEADLPAWLHQELAASGLDPAAETAALSARAAFDLRVNGLKGSHEEAVASLAADGLAAAPAPLAPGALRVAAAATARPKLSRLHAYQEGLVEPQDAGSQAAALVAVSAFRAARGEAAGPGLALDLCAGGGGKTLALAAALPRGARLCAYDVAPQRLADLPERLARAGAAAEILSRDDLAGLRGAADLALVDAPCSGSGAWARRPDAKWRLTPERLTALHGAQDEALALGAAAVRPGGVLVYVTCSLFASENAARLERFRATHLAFAALAAAPLWRGAGLGSPPPPGPPGAAAETALMLSPARSGTDGFFIAALRRAAAS